jgi:hypothetical protein
LLLANSLMLTNFIDQIMETISAITFEGDENDSGKSTEPEHINAIHLYLLEYNLPAVDETKSCTTHSARWRIRASNWITTS